MRLLLAAIIGALGTATFAQTPQKLVIPAATQASSCAQIAPLLLVKPTSAVGRLFLRDEGKWKEAEYAWWSRTDFSLTDYHGQQLAFIYAAPPAAAFRGRQFLSIRTVAYNDSSTNYVNLRKRRGRKGSPFIQSQVHIGQYQNYHQDGKSSGILTVFHQWFDGSRSDTPSETRKAWAFEAASDVARRRVLAVSYVPSVSQMTCVRFWLGPNIAAPNDEDAAAEGFDEALGPFTIEISEAKTGTGSSGRTFTIRSEPLKH